MDVTGGIKLEKVNNTNFHAWKQEMQFVLSLRQLYDFVNDDPPTMDADNYPEWCKNDRKAVARIGLSLSDEHLEHVQGVHSAKEMWQCILNSFERHTLFNKLAALAAPGK